MRDRADLIENLKEAHAHLLICTEDIQYPLPDPLDKYLEVSERAVGQILVKLLKEDIAAALGAIGEGGSEL